MKNRSILYCALIIFVFKAMVTFGQSPINTPLEGDVTYYDAMIVPKVYEKLHFNIHYVELKNEQTGVEIKRLMLSETYINGYQIDYSIKSYKVDVIWINVEKLKQYHLKTSTLESDPLKRSHDSWLISVDDHGIIKWIIKYKENDQTFIEIYSPYLR